MAPGLCCGKRCGKVFTVVPGTMWTYCPVCGTDNNNESAMRRYDELPAQGALKAPPTFDPSEATRKDGKIRMELVLQGMPNALLALGEIMTWAVESKGYVEGDFLNVPDAKSKYRGALYRHDLKEMLGQMTDEESGKLHAAHTAWNALARLEILLREGKQA